MPASVRAFFVQESAGGGLSYKARKSKNNLALIRKFAFNILKIACIHDDAGKGIQEMSDWFADDINLIAKYVFNGIQRIR